MVYYKKFLIRELQGCLRGTSATFVISRAQHWIPFLNFYERETGEQMEGDKLNKIKQRHPKLEQLSAGGLSEVCRVLRAHGIGGIEACAHPHLLTMQPLSIDNYSRVLRECGFHILQPQYIIKYHRMVKSYSITYLKNKGLIAKDLDLEEQLIKCFELWPPTHLLTQKLPEADSSILQVRLKILKNYLNWRLDVSDVEFENYCRHYLVLKHRPFAKIQEAIELAQNEIHFSIANIRRNGFLISADPTNTKQILNNIPELAGVDIRQVIRLVPAIIKNNHAAVLRIRDILKEYEISEEIQRRCFMVYCMAPESVEERLAYLSTMKEFQVLSSNPRALQLVVHHKKLVGRLSKLRSANKQCYSIANLLCSSHCFDKYVTNFGSRTCSRDLAAIICSSLNVDMRKYTVPPVPLKTKAVRRTASGESIVRVAEPTVTAPVNFTMAQLRRHCYWKNVPQARVHANIELLKRHFDDEVIYKHCQLLLYPQSEIEDHLAAIERRRGERREECAHEPDSSFTHLDYSRLSDDQLLSLVLYTIERKYHFTGDGIWSKSEAQHKNQAKAEN